MMPVEPANPLAVIAELTHRCPLRCVYCSNPIELAARDSELNTDAWHEVIRQAAKLGVVQFHLTGGEPLLRRDLVELTGAASAVGLYTNLITSGLGLSPGKMTELASAGLDHVQLSIQDADESWANRIAGARSYRAKFEAAEVIRKARESSPLAFTVNMVIHRRNADRLVRMIALAEALGADRLEIAHVQYYGWAFRNRRYLLPERGQVDSSVQVVNAARERLRGKMRIDFVVPDYHATTPKACMGGWGRKFILIDPKGRAMPCHSADVIPGISFDRVTEHDLEWIWRESAAFNRYRGEAWMADPCRSCERRDVDFGGCRCQAQLLTRDAAAADPVCRKSPARQPVIEAIREASGMEEGNPFMGYVQRSQAK